MKLSDFKRIALVENQWLKLLQDNYTLPNGAPCTYYHVMQQDAVMAIAVAVIDAELSTVIVRQYRHPVGQEIWQFPLGGFNPDTDSATNAAAKELAEETGFHFGSVEKTGSFYANPGFTNQKVHVCVASEITGQSAVSLDATEYGLVSKIVPVADILPMIESGEMGDAWGITGLHYLNRYADDLK